MDDRHCDHESDYIYLAAGSTYMQISYAKKTHNNNVVGDDWDGVEDR